MGNKMRYKVLVETDNGTYEAYAEDVLYAETERELYLYDKEDLRIGYFSGVRMYYFTEVENG